VLQNAGAVTLTVTLPGATTVVPAPTNPSAGVYSYDYQTTVAGRHTVRWVFSGANAGAFGDVFHVQTAAVSALVPLADMRTKLNLTGTDAARDEQLRRYIDVASAVCEATVGPVATRTVVERVPSYAAAVVLAHPPVVSVTSVVAGTVTAAAASYELFGPSGVLRAKSGTLGADVTVTYVAGRPVVPDDILEGVIELVRHLWKTKQGPTAPNRLGPGESADTYAQPGYGYLLPHRVEQLWAPFVPLAMV
jgi:hypothetical protein